MYTCGPIIFRNGIFSISSVILLNLKSLPKPNLTPLEINLLTVVFGFSLDFQWPLRSRHTSGRSFLKPYGHCGYLFVKVGNVLSERSLLFALLASWCGLRWIMEQPDGSFMPHLPKFQWLFGVLKASGLSKFVNNFLIPISKDLVWVVYPVGLHILYVYGKVWSKKPQEAQIAFKL